MNTFFYIKVIKQGNEFFVGYGITDNLEKRNQEHLENLTMAGYEVISTDSVSFDNRAKAKALEDEVKRNTRLIDLKVDGFRTEAAPIAQLAYITMMAVRAATKPSDSNPKNTEQADHGYVSLLSPKKRQMYEENIARMEADLESGWSIGKIKGATYRAKAKELLEISLKNLRSPDKNIVIYFPKSQGFWYFASGIHTLSGVKFELYKGQHSELSLDYLRRSVLALQSQIDRRLEQRKKRHASNTKASN